MLLEGLDHLRKSGGFVALKQVPQKHPTHPEAIQPSMKYPKGPPLSCPCLYGYPKQA